MDPKLPKKRGRKKKIKLEEVTRPVENKQTPLFSNDDTNSSRLNKKPAEYRRLYLEKRAARIREMQDRIEVFDRLAESDEFFQRIHRKFMDEKYPNHSQREEGYDLKYKEVYRRLRNKSSTPDDQLLWINTITKDAVEKVCDMINHLLSSGPLTESEIDILDRCVSLLKAYYVDRTGLIIKNPQNKNYYYSNTYLPLPNTYAYRIFISKYELPITTFLINNERLKTDC